MQTHHVHSSESTPNQALVLSTQTEIRHQLQQILHNAGWEVSSDVIPTKLADFMAQPSWSLILVVENKSCTFAGEILEQLAVPMRAGKVFVIVLSASPSANEAMLCMQRGASDYLAWPLLPSEILKAAEKIRRQCQFKHKDDKHALSQGVTNSSAQKVLIGRSRVMLELSQQLVKVAQLSALPVLLNGETGTGKEVVAWQLHQLSNCSGAFRAINCAAMVESLLESELFGHERGAFTGAHTTKKGLWEEAANGTLFLDEITEAPPSIQAKLLRVLQEGTIRRVGSNQEIRVTARIIAASNRELEEAVRKGEFRKDLFYRLGQVLHIPPLRERVEDIPLLVGHFCQRTAQEIEVTAEAMEVLCAYEWPGNVRELESLIAKLATFCGHRIFPEDVLLHLPNPHHQQPLRRPYSKLLQTLALQQWPTWQQVRAWYVMEAYYYFGQEAKVARTLGMDYRTVSSIIQDFQQRHK